MLRVVVALLLLLGSATALRSQATVLPQIAGRITDAEGGVIPGVRVIVVGDRVRREAVTDAQGRFVFGDVALGTYRVETQLAGFSTRFGVVTLSASLPRAHLAWSLEIGCLMNPQRVLFSPREAAPLVEQIVHLRVDTDWGPVSWSSHPDCPDVMRSYATVLLSEKPQRKLDVFLRVDDAQLQVGREYLVLMWPGALAGDDLVYLVSSGRVVPNAPAPIGGMPIDEALTLLKGLAKRPPR